MSLVARRWTFSILSISFFLYGLQTLAAYSKWGRTNALYNRQNVSISRYLNDLYWFRSLPVKGTPQYSGWNWIWTYWIDRDMQNKLWCGPLVFIHLQGYKLVLMYFSYINYISNGGWRASCMAAMQICKGVTISPYGVPGPRAINLSFTRIKSQAQTYDFCLTWDISDLICRQPKSYSLSVRFYLKLTWKVIYRWKRQPYFF